MLKYYPILILTVSICSSAELDSRFKDVYSVLGVFIYIGVQLHPKYPTFKDEMQKRMKLLVPIKLIDYDNLINEHKETVRSAIKFIDKYDLLGNEKKYQKPIARYIQKCINNGKSIGVKISMKDIEEFCNPSIVSEIIFCIRDMCRRIPIVNIHRWIGRPTEGMLIAN